MKNFKCLLTKLRFFFLKAKAKLERERDKIFLGYKIFEPWKHLHVNLSDLDVGQDKNGKIMIKYQKIINYMNFKNN